MKLIKKVVKSRIKEINQIKNKKKKADNKKMNNSSRNSINHINKAKEGPVSINSINNSKDSKTSNNKSSKSNPFTITNLSKIKAGNRWSNNKIESTANNIQINSVNNNTISSSAMNYISFTLINSQRENRLSILDIIPNDTEKIWTICSEKWEVNQTDDDSFYQNKNDNDLINEDEDEDENEDEYNLFKINESLRISRESQLIYNEKNENEKWTQKEEQWIVDNNNDRLESFYEKDNFKK